jgi:hypothetical protein
VASAYNFGEAPVNLIVKYGIWINVILLITVMLPGVKQVLDEVLLSVNIKTKKGEKSCEEVE